MTPRTDKPYETSRSSALAKLRIRAGLTSTAAALGLVIPVARLRNVEHGARASEELLQKMATLYGVSELSVTRAYRASRRGLIAREGL